jgi:hypothetical protein
MLAVVTAAHGQDPSHVLIILAAIAAAVFWRGLIKIGIALIIILFALLMITGMSAVLHEIGQVIP